MDCRISVVVPVYNVERYLPEALDSIIAQSVSDWECVLVDDGSTDGSGRVCDGYAARDRRFKVVHQPNAGAGAARNTGLDAATGEYLFFMDPDSSASALSGTSGVRGGAGPGGRGHFPGDQISYPGREFRACVFQAPVVPTGIPGEAVFRKERLRPGFIQYFGVTVWDKLFRRAFVVDNRIRFQPVRKYNDMCFAMECGFLAERISTSRFPGYLQFAERKGSLQNSGLSNRIMELVAAECECRAAGMLDGVWEPYVEEYFSLRLEMGYVPPKPPKRTLSKRLRLRIEDRLKQLAIGRLWPEVRRLSAGR